MYKIDRKGILNKFWKLDIGNQMKYFVKLSEIEIGLRQNFRSSSRNSRTDSHTILSILPIVWKYQKWIYSDIVKIILCILSVSYPKISSSPPTHQNLKFLNFNFANFLFLYFGQTFSSQFSKYIFCLQINQLTKLNIISLLSRD